MSTITIGGPATPWWHRVGTWMRRYIAPLLLIALAILSGLLAAILARAFLVQITKGFIGVLEGITPSPQLHLLPNSWRGALVEIQPIDPKAIGFDYGVGAFGAAFLFTKMEELVDSASTLIKQRTTATTSVVKMMRKEERTAKPAPGPM